MDKKFPGGQIHSGQVYFLAVKFTVVASESIAVLFGASCYE